MSHLQQYEQQILQGKVCPYCNKSTKYVDSSVIYGISYGMIYLCEPCDAYVGVHKGTDTALGRVTNKELRSWKKLAHKHFDEIWDKTSMTRDEAYKWLSVRLEIPPEYTHIGMFNSDTCNEVVRISKMYMNSMYPIYTDKIYKIA